MQIATGTNLPRLLSMLQLMGLRSLIISFLYFLFTDKTITDQEIPILVACNKSDLVTHRKSEEIKNILENELYGANFPEFFFAAFVLIYRNLIRDSQASQPGRHEAEEQAIFLGIEGEKFTIDQLEIPVQFANITVLGTSNTSSIDSVIEFMKEMTDS
jgi:signal recognition particle receptor subunit beta